MLTFTVSNTGIFGVIGSGSQLQSKGDKSTK